jgi:hypothetical protein
MTASASSSIYGEPPNKAFSERHPGIGQNASFYGKSTLFGIICPDSEAFFRDK